MKRLEKKIMMLEAVIAALVALLIFVCSAFGGYWATQQIFMDTYEQSIDKARYVDEMAESKYLEWKRMKDLAR